MSFIGAEATQALEILSRAVEDPTFLQSQRHVCWCLGDARNYGIGNHGIDLVIPEYFVLINQMVDIEAEAKNGGQLADDILNCIFNEINCIFIPVSLWSNHNKSALVQIMAWRWIGDKPLSEPMLA